MFTNRVQNLNWVLYTQTLSARQMANNSLKKFSVFINLPLFRGLRDIIPVILRLLACVLRVKTINTPDSHFKVTVTEGKMKLGGVSSATGRARSSALGSRYVLLSKYVQEGKERKHLLAELHGIFI